MIKAIVPLATVIFAFLALLGGAGCLQGGQVDRSEEVGLTIRKLDLEQMDPTIRAQVREDAVHVAADHAQERVPVFLDALRTAMREGRAAIADQEDQDATIAYLEELSGRGSSPWVEFEEAYFEISQVVT